MIPAVRGSAADGVSRRARREGAPMWRLASGLAWLLSAATALLVGCIGGAAAAPPDGLYVSLRGGATFLRDTDMTIEISGLGSIPAKLHYDTGWLVGAAVGYAWVNGLAIEGEFTYRQNGVDHEDLM